MCGTPAAVSAKDRDYGSSSSSSSSASSSARAMHIACQVFHLPSSPQQPWSRDLQATMSAMLAQTRMHGQLWLLNISHKGLQHQALTWPLKCSSGCSCADQYSSVLHGAAWVAHPGWHVMFENRGLCPMVSCARGGGGQGRGALLQQHLQPADAQQVANKLCSSWDLGVKSPSMMMFRAGYGRACCHLKEGPS
jgi:hypothetical protein